LKALRLAINLRPCTVLCLQDDSTCVLQQSSGW
jgi:hypothetical protein